MSPRYFDTLRLPMASGRAFLGNEGSGRLVAIVDETFARRTWPDGDAVGQTVRHTPLDPVSFAGGFALFSALALIAALIPARRAASVNRVAAIRAE